jgi:hypothetical protein
MAHWPKKWRRVVARSAAKDEGGGMKDEEDGRFADGVGEVIRSVVKLG